ncbi:type VI secretion system accessory protein TagJ [Caballeronia sp. LZ008]|uniref:type VI secretion system accessory protein TagJ n=1 Tax=unclassified Caballeronia TaxID=2646786 RepID=UPI002028BC3D|nr:MULTISPECIES: type VI secretion system accessory protein TagJ [unclassified Caballeronia]MDR5796406.1 type VI secretion system accessory protein TagJ [Caballeronia sp. LZ008]
MKIEQKSDIASPAPLARAPLSEQMGEIEARVRAKPGVAANRWALFQYLCVIGEWERAMQQLQTYAQLDSSQTNHAHTYRDLVRAERAREKVLSGFLEPDYVFDDVPDWMRGLLAALGLFAQGEMQAADDAREKALNLAPLVAGAGAAHSFAWISDSDTRLGPVCEFFAAGRYRWLALDDIAAWHIGQPGSLADLVWAPCTLKLRDGAVLHGFMPARYPVLAPEREARDTLLLGRETRWQEGGRTGVMASGGKTWLTSAGDVGLFELRECTFDHQGASRDSSTGAQIT